MDLEQPSSSPTKSPQIPTTAPAVPIAPILIPNTVTKTAAGMGGAVIFVITIASALTWIINKVLLVNFKLEYLQTIVFIRSSDCTDTYS